jgi:hypothetical protein
MSDTMGSLSLRNSTLSPQFDWQSEIVLAVEKSRKTRAVDGWTTLVFVLRTRAGHVVCVKSPRAADFNYKQTPSL